MAQIKLFKFDTDGFQVEHDPTADDITALSLSSGAGGISAGGNIAMNSNKITGLAPGTANNDGVNKEQLDQAVISGGTVKELLFDQVQLDNAQGILALEVLFFDGQPTAGDTVVVDDGTTTVTMTAVANQGSEVSETDFSIETSAKTALQRLVTRFNAATANTKWTMTYRETEHPDLSADGIVVVTEDTTGAGASPSRIYTSGAWATPADIQVVEFATGATPTVDLDYQNETPVTPPTSDPGAGRFGLRRTQANLVANEIHFVRTNDFQYSWDDDTNTWQVLSGAGAVPDATAASGGGIKGKITFDSDKGLDISSGIGEAKIDAVTIDFNGSGQMKVTGLPSLFEVNGTPVSANVDAAALNTLTGGGNADSEHVHAAAGITLDHADLNNVTADQHHNRQHAITSAADHSETGLTTGHVLTATGSTTFAWQAPAVPAKARSTRWASTAAVALAVGEPVYPSSNDNVSPCDNTNNNTRKYSGVCSQAAAGAAATEVQQDGLIVPTTIGGSPSAGDLVYLNTPKGVTVTLPTGSGTHRLVVGKMVNATTMVIEPQYLGKIN
jgi:hypothetical protein